MQWIIFKLKYFTFGIMCLFTLYWRYFRLFLASVEVNILFESGTLLRTDYAHLLPSVYALKK